MILAAGASAAAAAAAAKRRAESEEEQMTPYRPQDLAEDWEFKILRSMSGAFKDQATLRLVLDEERRAGWVLVEKFDNSRLRLKRPAAARAGDAALEFDAYRTYYGPTEGKFTLMIIAMVFGILVGVFVLIAVLANALH